MDTIRIDQVKEIVNSIAEDGAEDFKKILISKLTEIERS